MSSTLILGGARSGKSRYAEGIALSESPAPIYLATSRIWDDDHRARIEKHRSERGPEWTTVEEEKRLSKISYRARTVVVDCLTLWLTNYFIDLKQDPVATLTAIKDEIKLTASLDNHWIFVSNEVGMGVHAPTESGRKFADLQGSLNQYVAALASRVVLMVAGIPMIVKDVRSEEQS